MNNENLTEKKSGLKVFFIKLISSVVAVIIVINVIFNVFFAERLEKLDQFLLLDRNDTRQNFKDKVKEEIENSLEKENLIYEEDKILLYKLYNKLKKEFEDLDKSKLQ